MRDVLRVVVDPCLVRNAGIDKVFIRLRALFDCLAVSTHYTQSDIFELGIQGHMTCSRVSHSTTPVTDLKRLPTMTDISTTKAVTDRLQLWSVSGLHAPSFDQGDTTKVRLRRSVAPAFSLRGFNQCLWNDVLLGRVTACPHVFTLYDVLHCNSCYLDPYPCDEKQRGHAVLHWDGDEGSVQVDLSLQTFLRAVLRWFFVHLPGDDNELLRREIQAFEHAGPAVLEDMTQDLRLAFPQEPHSKFLVIDIADRSRELWDMDSSPMNTWLSRCWERLWLVRCNADE